MDNELWRLAESIAMLRLGITPSGADPLKGCRRRPGANATRAERRRYRKLWRMDLVRELREFAKAPPRRYRGRQLWAFVLLDGVWVSEGDPLLSRAMLIQELDVGAHPSRAAMTRRWARILRSPRFRRELKRAAGELGLLRFPARRR